MALWGNFFYVRGLKNSVGICVLGNYFLALVFSQNLKVLVISADKFIAHMLENKFISRKNISISGSALNIFYITIFSESGARIKLKNAEFIFPYITNFSLDSCLQESKKLIFLLAALKREFNFYSPVAISRFFTRPQSLNLSQPTRLVDFFRPFLILGGRSELYTPNCNLGGTFFYLDFPKAYQKQLREGVLDVVSATLGPPVKIVPHYFYFGCFTSKNFFTGLVPTKTNSNQNTVYPQGTFYSLLLGEEILCAVSFGLIVNELSIEVKTKVVCARVNQLFSTFDAFIKRGLISPPLKKIIPNTWVGFLNKKPRIYNKLALLENYEFAFFNSGELGGFIPLGSFFLTELVPSSAQQRQQPPINPFSFAAIAAKNRIRLLKLLKLLDTSRSLILLANVDAVIYRPSPRLAARDLRAFCSPRKPKPIKVLALKSAKQYKLEFFLRGEALKKTHITLNSFPSAGMGGGALKNFSTQAIKPSLFAFCYDRAGEACAALGIFSKRGALKNSVEFFPVAGFSGDNLIRVIYLFVRTKSPLIKHLFISLSSQKHKSVNLAASQKYLTSLKH